MFKVPEQFRVKTGPLASSNDFGNNGLFKITISSNEYANVIASDGDGWEHVSIHIINPLDKAKGKSFVRIPTWTEMCKIKDMFWGPEDEVMQLHPPKSQYVNTHNYTLHLWRPVKYHPSIPLPPPWLVGPSSAKFKPKSIISDLVLNLTDFESLRSQWHNAFMKSFVDHYTIFRKAYNKRTLSFEDVQHIANNAAEDYIQSLIKNENQ